MGFITERLLENYEVYKFVYMEKSKQFPYLFNFQPIVLWTIVDIQISLTVCVALLLSVYYVLTSFSYHRATT